MTPVSLRRALIAYHERKIHRPRVEYVARTIAQHVAEAGSAESILDVGAGTGEVAAKVGATSGAKRVAGVDVKPRSGAAIEVTAYDGETLPFPYEAFDVVIASDVLHHCPDPVAVLRECLRVCRRAVVVKDHFRFSRLSDWALWVMDVAGNAGPEVHVEGRYFDFASFVQAVSEAGGTVARLTWPLRIHEWPFCMVTRAEWQFVATVSPRR